VERIWLNNTPYKKLFLPINLRFYKVESLKKSRGFTIHGKAFFLCKANTLFPKTQKGWVLPPSRKFSKTKVRS
jgi:hypothetical protein